MLNVLFLVYALKCYEGNGDELDPLTCNRRSNKMCIKNKMADEGTAGAKIRNRYRQACPQSGIRGVQESPK